MQKVIICQGIPGSGKSFFAKQYVKDHPEFVRVNRDDLRNMRGMYWMPKQEDLITAWQIKCIASALELGFNVVSDDTNLNPKFLKHLEDSISGIEATIKENNFSRALYGTLGNRIINPDWKIEIEYKSFKDTPLTVCIKRDLERPNSVGEKIIRNFYYRYIMNVDKYNPSKELPKAIICDLDGTLCLFGNNNAYDREFIKDQVNKPVFDILNKFVNNVKPHKVILLSGRSNKFSDETLKWLDMHKVPYDALYMRKQNDGRKDCDVKKELFDTHIKDKYQVDFVLDDRNQVVDLWRSMGLTCLQVAEGNF